VKEALAYWNWAWDEASIMAQAGHCMSVEGGKRREAAGDMFQRHVPGKEKRHEAPVLFLTPHAVHSRL
jgi:hypothetical protein